MASFYRDPPYLNQMDKAFTTDQTRTRSVSSRFGNLTKATSNIVLPCSNDAIVDPLAKEIVNRLEVINRIVPQVNICVKINVYVHGLLLTILEIIVRLFTDSDSVLFY